MITLRDYQQEAVDKTFNYWATHQSSEDIPLLWLPTAAGKSIICAGIVDKAFSQWPEHHPRSLVIVPSKELAEQNGEKLAGVLPNNLSLGYYSASLGKRQSNADVIVATIGSVAKKAHLLGNIKLVIVDEAHLISSDGSGQYRQFLRDLAKYCNFRVVGMTATPFRGNGVWLTDGKDPLFTGIAYEVPMQLLLERGYLSPLVRPSDVLRTIDTTGVGTSNGDYKIDELSRRVDEYLEGVALDTIRLAKDRKKWIAFTPNVATAQHLTNLLSSLGIATKTVTGDTPKREREAIVNEFKTTERTRCLVSVLALAVGFDVPSVDCVIWARPTQSPVLYVQGAGRGMRISPETGKTDCLWLDFTDTTERLGPIDQIRGRASTGKGKGEAPFAVCDNCGAQVRPASLLRCPECDFLMREPEAPKPRDVSDAPVMSTQVEQKLVRYEVTDLYFEKHNKPGKPPSLKVVYCSGPKGIRVVCTEYICLEHEGFAKQKAVHWWRSRVDENTKTPGSVDEALDWIWRGCRIRMPSVITVNESGKYPFIVSHNLFEENQGVNNEYEPTTA